ncbi:hypothetical protein KAX17_13425 [Candidatus Bipolaricaulota bacterium]|nr:hypothetical protein [Candidatus Bipolaricaulota bacterium]MCK4600094.1 hypothetical protein [Candidatus Bipolaricaulota bacterium]
MMTRTERLLRYSDNAQWFFEHLDELRADARFRGKFVAIDRSEVIATHESIETLEALLDAMRARDRAKAAMVDYVSEKPCAMLL